MSWCDKLASTPGIGVKLDKSFAPVAALLEPLTPIVSTWVNKENDQATFSIEHQDLFGCVLSNNEGYQYNIGPEALVLEYRHRLRFRPRSGGPPTAELLSKPQPYTELLPQITAKLLEVVRLVTAGKPRKLQRIGVISTTVVGEDEVPPGIGRFLKYVRRPWDAEVDSFNIEITPRLPKQKGTSRYDRCIHQISKPEDNEGLVTIRLDWQRYFDGDRSLSMTTLPELLETAKKDALEYFEDIGEGERFDV